jgi:F-type H+-transporting ATPase subunit gamma
MANVRDYRTRIRSVKSTQQITRAMKLVSAARLRRSQDRILAARPYARKMLEVLSSLAARARPERHPLLSRRPEEKVLVVVITADKGLCGSFNTNILNRARAFLDEQMGRVAGEKARVDVIGRKARDWFRRRAYPVRRTVVDIFKNVTLEEARGIAGDLIDLFARGEFDAVYLVYNEFKSVIQQRVVVERLLPIQRLELPPSTAVQDYIYEPSPQALFDVLLPRHVEFQVLRALYESAAAEFGARMSAMDAATRNADEMIHSLTLNMNRVRQASITREIIEVVGGAEAT